MATIINHNENHKQLYNTCENHEANSINSCMQSPYYSLTATTTTEEPTSDPSEAPILASFMLVSGASLSVTNALKDLFHPIKLPTPIPITSANRTTTHATHVGRHPDQLCPQIGCQTC